MSKSPRLLFALGLVLSVCAGCGKPPPPLFVAPAAKKDPYYYPPSKPSSLYHPETAANPPGNATFTIMTAFEARLDTLKLARPRHDENLSALAVELAEYMRRTEQAPPPEYMRFAAQWVGVGDVDVNVQSARFGDGPNPARFASDMAEALTRVPKAAQPTHVGFGQVDDQRKGAYAVAVFVRRGLFVKPFPKLMPAGGPLKLLGRFYDEQAQAVATFTLPDGKSYPVTIKLGEKGLFELGADVPANVERVDLSIGVMNGQVQVPIAVFPIRVREAEPERFLPPAISADGKLTSEEAAKYVLEQLNPARTALGLAPLELARESVLLAEGWARTGAITPDQAKVELDRGGLRSFYVKTAVLSGPSVPRIYALAAGQAALKAVFFDPYLTHAGAGVFATDDGRGGTKTSLALVLVSAPLMTGNDARAEAVLARVNRMRQGKGLAPLQRMKTIEPVLTEAADMLVEKPDNRDSAREKVLTGAKKAFGVMPRSWQTGLYSTYSLNADPPDKIAAALLDPKITYAAFGVSLALTPGHAYFGHLVYFVLAEM